MKTIYSYSESNASWKLVKKIEKNMSKVNIFKNQKLIDIYIYKLTD